ncbi:RHTO0S16e03994g1_1 [Rhodotorula toruloides]|uniref:RHTO0S16e03994g1_1 n=1 Tax=Rhodotorula toruloides TaxID=5286 RepID=A0A061BJY4_RHOTO|nr:RHTO0S16e03994g1_1 [Rhodotorula toruloides]
MPFSSFRSPAIDLADFLRSLAVPRAFYSSSTPGTSSQQEHEWEILRARQGGTKRLDFFDHELSGPDGAVAVLRAVEKSPGVTALALSQNHLGDDGMRELLVGLKRLRSRDIGAHLEELNLSDCRLSDVSLHLLTLQGVDFEAFLPETLVLTCFAHFPASYNPRHTLHPSSRST